MAKRQNKILVVDKQIANRRLLESVLSDEHDIFFEQSGAAAEAILKNNEISLVIADQHLSDMTGVQFFAKAIAIQPDTIRVLLTDKADAQMLIDAVNAGHVYKYITKPWHADDLRLTILRALETYQLAQNNHKLLSDLKNTITQLEEMTAGIIAALADALDAKCDYTSGHSLRVSRIAVAIGKALGLAASDLKDLEIAGILHDIGKIGVPESILWKSAKLNAEELQIMSLHPSRSAQIIRELKGFARARDYVLHHHEYINGSGYPDGLAGDKIPFGAKIILVADAYDAMTTDRPYRKAIGHRNAISELRQHAGSQFEPKIVETLVLLFGEAGESVDATINASESFLGMTIAAIDPQRIGQQYLAEAERQARHQGGVDIQP